MVVCVRSCVSNKTCLTLSLSEMPTFCIPIHQTNTAKSVRHHEDLRNQQKNLKQLHIAHVKLLNHPVFFRCSRFPIFKVSVPSHVHQEIIQLQGIHVCETSWSQHHRDPCLRRSQHLHHLLMRNKTMGKKHHPIGIAHRTLDWFKGKSAGKSENLQEKPIFHGENRWFPVDFVLKKKRSSESNIKSPSSFIFLGFVGCRWGWFQPQNRLQVDIFPPDGFKMEGQQPYQSYIYIHNIF